MILQAQSTHKVYTPLRYGEKLCAEGPWGKSYFLHVFAGARVEDIKIILLNNDRNHIPGGAGITLILSDFIKVRYIQSKILFYIEYPISTSVRHVCEITFQSFRTSSTDALIFIRKPSKLLCIYIYIYICSNCVINLFLDIRIVESYSDRYRYSRILVSLGIRSR